MAATSAAVSVSASTVATTTSNLSSSNNCIDWGFKGYHFMLFIRGSSWEILTLCSNSLVHLILFVCFDGILLVRLSYGTLAILLGIYLGSLYGFTLIFVQMLGGSLYSFTNIGLTGRCSDFLDKECWNIVQVVLTMVWHRFVDASTELLLIMLNCCSISTVSCDNTFLKYIINNKWATSITYTSINQIRLHKAVNMI